jgi:hypothetical protein
MSGRGHYFLKGNRSTQKEFTAALGGAPKAERDIEQ